jgi:hypothetical protein
LDLRPVALAKNYFAENGAFRFRHVMSPFLTYRFIKGVNNFNRIIRFDYTDTQSDTTKSNTASPTVSTRANTRKPLPKKRRNVFYRKITAKKRFAVGSAV